MKVLMFCFSVFYIVSCKNAATAAADIIGDGGGDPTKKYKIEMNYNLYTYAEPTRIVSVSYISGGATTSLKSAEIINGKAEIPSGSIVTITIRPAGTDDYYFIGGDVTNGFNGLSKQYKFTMNADKTFDIYVESKEKGPIAKIFYFEAPANGTIDILVKDKLGSTKDTISVKSGKKESITVFFNEENATATAKANSGDSIFTGWEYHGRVETLKLTSDTYSDKVLKPSFARELTTTDMPGNQDYDGYIWIEKPEHLEWISKNSTIANNYLEDKKYKLSKDIDFNGSVHYTITQFNGIIDGNGKSIKNAIFVSDNPYLAFVAILNGKDTSHGIIKNLTIDSSVKIVQTLRPELISGNTITTSVAGIVGRIDGFAKVSYCTNRADIIILGGWDKTVATIGHIQAGGISTSIPNSDGRMEYCSGYGNIYYNATNAVPLGSGNYALHPLISFYDTTYAPGKTGSYKVINSQSTGRVFITNN